MMECTYLNVT